MTQRTQRKKTGMILALLLPITMLLSACKWDNTIDITPSGGLNFAAELIDTEGLTSASGVTCEMLSDLMADDELFPTGSFEVEDISEGSNLGCRFVVATPIASDEILVDNGDSYTLNIGSSATNDMYIPAPDSLGPLEFTFNVTMPGPIIEASEGGQINGNTVTFTDPAVLESGFSVTGQKSGDLSGGSTWNDDGDDDGEADPESSQASGSAPTWPWFLIGGGVLTLVGVAIALLMRRRTQGPAVGDSGAGGFAAGDPGAGGSGAAGFSNPPYGQPGHASDQGTWQPPSPEPGK
ncbi:MAG: hypothetical protein QM705_08330 [Ancrocorticia sp.]